MSFDEDQLPPPDARGSRPLNENPDSADLRDSGDFVRCPFCKKYIFEDAEQCPYCKHFITRHATHGHPSWLVITVIIAIILMILVYIVGIPMPLPPVRPSP